MRYAFPLLIALALPVPVLAGGGYGGGDDVISQDIIMVQRAPQFADQACYGQAAAIIQQAPIATPYVVQQQAPVVVRQAAPVFIQRQAVGYGQQIVRQQIVRQRAVYAQQLPQQVFRQRQFVQRAPVFADAGGGGGSVQINNSGKLKIKRSFGFFKRSF